MQGLPKIAPTLNIKKWFFTAIHNEIIYFIQCKKNTLSHIKDIPLKDILTNPQNTLPKITSSFGKNNKVLIIPDHWIENFSFEFRTIKKSILQSYIEKTLSSFFPDAPETKYYYNYQIDRGDQNIYKLHVYHLKESTIIELCNIFNRYGLTPETITTPGLIWGEKLKTTQKSFNNGGKLLIHLPSFTTTCLAYFFFNGNLLFIRSVPLEGTGIEASEKIKTIAYEINQSLYLFSQKTKSEVDDIYLVSNSELHEIYLTLQKNLGKEITELRQSVKPEIMDRNISDLPLPLKSFTITELYSYPNNINLLDRRLREINKINPLQKAAFWAGLTILALLLAEFFFLNYKSAREKTPITQEIKTENILRKYKRAVSLLTIESKQPFPPEIIAKIIKAIPKGVWIKKITINMETQASVYMEGIINVPENKTLSDRVSLLTSNLEKAFQTSKPISLQKVNLEPYKTKGYKQDYIFNLKFPLQ